MNQQIRPVSTVKKWNRYGNTHTSCVSYQEFCSTVTVRWLMDLKSTHLMLFSAATIIGTKENWKPTLS